MRLRRLRPGEEPLLWPVFHDAVHHLAAAHYSPAQLEAWAPHVPDMDRWVRRIRALAPWVAALDGTPVGYGDVQDDGLVDHLFVHPDQARRGVASRLLERLLEDAARRGIGRVHTHASLTARPFFERHGFDMRARRTVPVGDQVLAHFLMDREVTAPDAA